MKRSLVITLIAVLAAASCTDRLDQANVNPNSIAVGEGKMRGDNLFEPIFYGIGKTLQSYTRSYGNEICGITAHTAGISSNLHRYVITNGNWQSLYDGFMRWAFDCDVFVRTSVESGDAYFEAIGRILKSLCYYNLVTIWGDVPYSEAFQGRQVDGYNRAPALDSQEDIFRFILDDLTRAADLMAGNPVPHRTGLDSMYGDDCLKWQKFANSLKMRIYCLLANLDEGNWARIQEMIDAPAAYPVFTSNDDNAEIPYKDQDPYRSYFGENQFEKNDIANYRLTEATIKMLHGKSYNDPRIAIYGELGGDSWKGTVAGCTTLERAQAHSGSAMSNFAVLGQAATPAILMDYSEILFIYAEGVALGKLAMPFEAGDYYYDAVNASIDRWAKFGDWMSPAVVITQPVRDAFFDSEVGNFEMAGTSQSIYKSQLDCILSQKWLSLFWCGFECWTSWRRNEFPILKIGRGCQNDFELPTRLGYPNSLTASNPGHVAEALARMGGENDMHTALIWSYKKLNGGSKYEHTKEYTLNR